MRLPPAISSVKNNDRCARMTKCFAAVVSRQTPPATRSMSSGTPVIFIFIFLT
jgi:hypothetical protein